MIELPRGRKRDFRLDEITYADGSKLEDSLRLDSEKSKKYAREIAVDHQEGYYWQRVLTSEAVRKIVKETFDFESVKDGAEFGCGAYGCFYNYLLPKNGTAWAQFDISPKMVEHNREHSKKTLRRPPKIEVGDWDEMPLEDSSMDAIVGLSALDCIYPYEKAINEIKRCLRPGGHFIHYQDLLPADVPLILSEANKRAKMGSDPNAVPCEFVRVNESNVPILVSIREYLVAIESTEYGNVWIGKYLTKHLRNLFSQSGFEVKLSDEIKKEALVKRWKFNLNTLRNLKYLHRGKENCFESAYGKFELKYNPSVPKGYIKQWAAMDVLVAQKP